LVFFVFVADLRGFVVAFNLWEIDE